MGFEIEDDVLERERQRLTAFFEAQAENMGVGSGRADWHLGTMNLCDRIWDARIGDRWINIDLSTNGWTDGFLKKFGLDDEIDLLTLIFPPDKIPLDLAWSFHRAWFYDRLNWDEMESWLDKMRKPPAQA